MQTSASRDDELRMLEEQNGQLLALFIASQRMASTLDMDGVLATILDILFEFTGASSASVWLRDQQSTDLKVSASRGIDVAFPQSVPLGAGIVGGVAASGEELLEGDSGADPATGLPVVAAVPLRLKDTLAGTVAIHGLLPHKPSLNQTDRELLLLIAGQAAAAITSARLYMESRAVLHRFRELGRRISTHLDDIDTVLTTTADTVARLVQADVCQLFLVDQETGDLALKAASGLGEIQVGASLRPGEGIAGRVMLEARALREDGGLDGGVTSGRLAPIEGGPAGTILGSVLAVPLRAANKLIGVLSVGRLLGSAEWDTDHELVLSTAADQLAVGINNALLYSRIEDDYFKMSTLFTAANRLHATLDLNEILRSSRDILESLIGARTYSILLLDEYSRELRIAISEGIPPVQRSSFRATIDEGFLARVIDSGQPYVAPPDQLPKERLYGQPVLACVPLRVEGVVVGALVINRLLSHKTGLIPHDNELFAMLVQHAATAILSARLYARAEQRLVTLYDLSRLISAAVSAEEILDLTMGLVTQVMKSRVAVLYSIERDAGVLKPTHVAGLENQKPEVTWRLGEGLVGQVAKSGESVETTDAASDQAFAGAESFYRGDTLLLPCQVGNTLVGVLGITDKLGNEPFSADDRRLAATLAGQVALILHHTSLFQQAQHLAILLEREREALRLANRDLNLVNQQLDALVEHLADGVILIDTEGRLLRINLASRQLLGLDGQEDLPIDILEDQIPDARTRDNVPVSLKDWPVFVAMRGESVSDFEMRITRRDGTVRDILISAEPIRDSLGHVEMAVAVFRDITARRDLERAKDEFIATASHELRNPLATMKGHTQIMLRRAAQERSQGPEVKSLSAINDQTDRMIRLVEQLLDLSRIELGRVVIERDVVDMVGLVEQLVADTRILNPGHRIDIVGADERLEGRWDRARLEQVISNLLTNACKFTPPGSGIEVEIRKEGENAMLTVRDAGQGIPADKLERIFDRYAQVGIDATRKGGLGLGLHISRKIVNAHGGNIWAESTEGAGAVFHVSLPIDAEGQVEPNRRQGNE